MLTTLAFTTPPNPDPDPNFGVHPDLIVRAIQFPQGFKVGTCTDVKVAIANLNNAEVTGKIQVELYVSPNGAPAYTLNKVMLGIGPKKTKFITFKDIKVPNKKQLKLRVRVNPKKWIQESNHYNNKKLIYPKPTDLCSSELLF